jgi:SSS family solute:Na+ symporter
MRLHWIDALMVLAPTLAVVYFAWRSQRYTRGVAQYMAAGRVAGRYLLAVADGVAGMGLISAIALFELYYASGFSVHYWQALGVAASLLLTLSGFVIYRFRQTRALTLAQFLEARYSRRFRVFSGALAAIAGIVNYGLFPAVGARFFIDYCQLPHHLPLLGAQVSTFALLIALFLGAALSIVLLGGQVTIMVTDCVQGLFTYSFMLLVVGTLLWKFGWSDVTRALTDRPAGQSLINPFDSLGLKDFNLVYVLISVLLTVYSTMAWQGNVGYRAAAINAQEARMGAVLGVWRSTVTSAVFILIAICALTLYTQPGYADLAAAAQRDLEQIANPAVQNQMRVPLAMAHALPVGVSGAFLAVMLFLMVTTDTTYLHSWSSILVQDVILPLRRRPLSTRAHLLLLRLGVVGVALFAFVFSLLFNQSDYILMFFMMTGAIYLGGAGSVIIGGLYWRYGTTAGAWVAMILGSGLAFGGMGMTQLWPTLVKGLAWLWPDAAWISDLPAAFPINGQWIWLIAMVASSTSYVVVSLLTSKGPHDLAAMLQADKGQPVGEARPTWRALLGIERELPLRDRIVSGIASGWTLGMLGLWGVSLLLNFLPATRWGNTGWSAYFWVTGLALPLGVIALTTVWFGIGGVIDLRRLFQRLAQQQDNPQDDGRVEQGDASAQVAHLQKKSEPAGPVAGERAAVDAAG